MIKDNHCIVSFSGACIVRDERNECPLPPNIFFFQFITTLFGVVMILCSLNYLFFILSRRSSELLWYCVPSNIFFALCDGFLEFFWSWHFVWLICSDMFIPAKSWACPHVVHWTTSISGWSCELEKQSLSR